MQCLVVLCCTVQLRSAPHSGVMPVRQWSHNKQLSGVMSYSLPVECRIQGCHCLTWPCASVLPNCAVLLCAVMHACRLVQSTSSLMCLQAMVVAVCSSLTHAVAYDVGFSTLAVHHTRPGSRRFGPCPVSCSLNSVPVWRVSPSVT